MPAVYYLTPAEAAVVADALVCLSHSHSNAPDNYPGRSAELALIQRIFDKITNGNDVARLKRAAADVLRSDEWREIADRESLVNWRASRDETKARLAEVAARQAADPAFPASQQKRLLRNLSQKTRWAVAKGLASPRPPFACGIR